MSTFTACSPFRALLVAVAFVVFVAAAGQAAAGDARLHKLPPVASMTDEGVRATAPPAAPAAIRTPAALTAATIHVPADYASIQAAINAASAGDIIDIAAGSYTENIVINKTLTLQGAGQGSTLVYPALSAPNPCANSSLCGLSASIIMLVQAHNIVIHDMTLDGDNASLTSGIVAGGADIDARIGIATNYLAGTYNGLQVHHVTVKNIYLRGIQNTYGTGFNFHDNTVQNVQADPSSIAMFNSTGGGIFANNTVADANDAISANHSVGTQFLNNVITGSGSGVHTDNAGDGGGTADVIDGNSVSNSMLYGYGIWVFVPYIAPTVSNNVVTNVDVGMGEFGGAFGPSPTVTVPFTNNTIDGMAKANSAGFYLTNTTFYYGNTNVKAAFNGNIVKNNVDGFYIESDNGLTLTLDGSFNLVTGNTSGTTQTFVPVAYGGSGTPGTVAGLLAMNWWGHISGPAAAANPGGLGQPYGSSLGFTPWLVYGTDAAPATAGFQLPSTIPLAAGGDISAADNDFRRIQNAMGCAAAGQTFDLSGTFDWSQPNALAGYTASYATSATSDLRGAKLRAGIANVTVTSSAHNAHIIGAGDINDGALIYSSFLFSDDGPNPGNANFALRYLDIDNFENALMFGWNNTGFFNGTSIDHTRIELAGDNGDATDWIQNVAIYFWNGQNQTMDHDTVTFKANGTRTVGFSGPANPASFGYQSGTTGGTGYNGLHITNNLFRVDAGSNGVEEVYGIWENGHNDDNASVITITGNAFLGRTGDLFDHAFKLSSQTSQLLIDGNALTDVDDLLFCNKSAGHSVGDHYAFSNNTLTRCGGADGIFLKNVTNDAVPIHVGVAWPTNNIVDGETGIRGLNELSVQATHAARPSGAASDLAVVTAAGPKPVTGAYNGASPGRFADPDGIGTGGGPLAYGFNTFTTVQTAVDSVGSSTVYVLPGTFNESQVSITKSLSLLGLPGAIIDGGGGSGLTNPGLVRITASGNVTVSGLTLRNAKAITGTFGTRACLYASSPVAGPVYTVANNLLIGTNSAADGSDYGLVAQDPGRDSLAFVHNRITQTGSNPVLIEKHEGATELAFDTLAVGLDGSSSIFYMSHSGHAVTTTQNVHHNYMDAGNVAGTAIAFNGSFTPPGGVGTFSHVLIHDNTIVNVDAGSRGITLYNRSGDANGVINGAVIDRNTISGDHSANSRGIQLINLVTNTVITNNTVSSVDHVFRGFLFGGGLTYPSGTTVTGNSFSNAISGFVWEDPASVLNATGNYWGSLHGPRDLTGTVELPFSPKPAVAQMKNALPASGLGIDVSDNVDYFPWTGPAAPAAMGLWGSGFVNPTSNNIFLGLDPGASDGAGTEDLATPPPPACGSDFLYYYFVIPSALSSYSQDIRKDEASVATTAKRWTLKGITDHPGSAVEIDFTAAGLPSGFHPTIYWLDTAAAPGFTGRYQDLSVNPLFAYTSPASACPTLSNFLVLIGDSAKPSVAVTAPNGGEFLIAGTPYTITWTSSDGSGVLRHYVWYSATGAAPYTLVDSVNGNVTSLSWTPPAPTLAASIKVTARDSVMNEQSDVSDHSFAVIASSTVSTNAAAGWNLVSPPMLQGDMTPAGLFGDDFGIVPFYTFQYVGGYTIPGSLNMGQGYWLGANSAQTIDAVGTPQSSVTHPLANGFNIIGNPFAVDYLLSGVKFTDGVTVKDLATAASSGWVSSFVFGYNGSGYLIQGAGSPLGVWKGYWLPVMTPGLSVIYDAVVVVPTPKPAADEMTAASWQLALGASLSVDGAAYSDDAAVFGVKSDASAGYDRLYDVPRPPRAPAQDFVEVAFPAPSSGAPEGLGREYARDIRGDAQDGWEFAVTTSQAGTVTLRWDAAQARLLPAAVRLLLRDETSKEAVDMRSAGSYSYSPTGTSRRFTINRGAAGTEVPKTFLLGSNFPNPFNPSTRIAYDIPVRAQVSLSVYDLLGRKIADLVAGEVDAGRHEVLFDASGLAGGIYICRMEAAGADGTKYSGLQKMLYVR